MKTFWQNKNNRSAFVRRYNLKYGKHTKTFFNKRDLLVQLRPTLIISYAWQKLLKITPGEGRVWNVDESMTYLRKKKSQTYSM